MIKNLIVTAIRVIKKNLFFSSINIIGLSIGIACSLLIWIWVQNELSYDKYHEKGERIYRLLQDMDYDIPVTWAINQGPLGPALVQDFPELESFSRYVFSNRVLETKNNKFREPGAYIDPGFFDIFSVNLIKKLGNEIFRDNRSVLLSEKLAQKYFPDEDPIGQNIILSDDFTFVVSGVFENIPKNSHLYFDYLLPMTYAKELGMSVDRWNNSMFYTYLLASEGSNQDLINSKIKTYLDDKPTLEKNTVIKLQALKDIYLKSNNDFDFVSGNLQYVQIFFAIAVFLILIACINFMNLNAARATRRAKEMGIRKVIGANKSNLINQNLFETFIQILISLILSIILIKLAQPSFNQIANKTLEFNLLNPQIFGTLLIILVLCTLISGVYPAIVLSMFSPAETIKGIGVKGSGNTLFSKSLVIFQFFISVVMIISTIVIQKQMSFIQNKDLGYNKENIVTFYMTDNINNNFENLKAELLQNPDIYEVARLSQAPDYGYTYTNSLWKWDGMLSEKAILFRHNTVGLDFFKLFEMEIIEGRTFSRNHSTDTLNTLILNETAVKAMGLKNPIGSRMKYVDDDFYHTVIGVVKDFNYGSLQNNIEPMILLHRRSNIYQVCIRIDETKTQDAIATIENKWNEIESNTPFDYQFLDQRFKVLYTSEKSVFKLVIIFAIIAIFISCLGLFGLTSYVIERKNKEIGVRKVFGANLMIINNQLLSYFLKWILIANIIAWPVSWIIMSRWLDGYAYHTKFSFWIFGMALLISLVISLTTIIFQSSKAASRNPIDILRYE